MNYFVIIQYFLYYICISFRILVIKIKNEDSIKIKNANGNKCNRTENER